MRYTIEILKDEINQKASELGIKGDKDGLVKALLNSNKVKYTREEEEFLKSNKSTIQDILILNYFKFLKLRLKEFDILDLSVLNLGTFYTKKRRVADLLKVYHEIILKIKSDMQNYLEKNGIDSRNDNDYIDLANRLIYILTNVESIKKMIPIMTHMLSVGSYSQRELHKKAYKKEWAENKSITVQLFKEYDFPLDFYLEGVIFPDEQEND